jgi:hypothetical protein
VLEASPSRRERGAVPVRLVLGLLVIVLGSLFLADNLGWVEARDLLHDFWPAAMVTLGVVLLLQPRARGPRRFWGGLWIFAGLWLFAEHRGWVRIDFWDLFLPFILLTAGASMVFRSLRGGGPRRCGPYDDPEGYLRTFAVMAGNEVRSTSAEFRGADLGAVMGGVTLDLTQAKMAAEEAVIDVFALWGGIEIRPPADWRIESRVAPILGGYEDKTRPSTATPSGRLLIRGTVVMGGIEVKN